MNLNFWLIDIVSCYINYITNIIKCSVESNNWRRGLNFHCKFQCMIQLFQWTLPYQYQYFRNNCTNFWQPTFFCYVLKLIVSTLVTCWNLHETYYWTLEVKPIQFFIWKANYVQGAGGTVRDSDRWCGVTSEHLIGAHKRRRLIQVRGHQQGGLCRACSASKRLRAAVCADDGQEGDCSWRHAGGHLSRCWVPYRKHCLGERWVLEKTFYPNTPNIIENPQRSSNFIPI